MRREIGASAGVIALLAFFLHTQFPPGTERSPELESGHEEHHDNERPAADMRHPVEGPWIATHAFFGHTNWWTMPSGPYAIHDERPAANRFSGRSEGLARSERPSQPAG